MRCDWEGKLLGAARKLQRTEAPRTFPPLQLEALSGRDARTLFLLETRLYDRRLLQASSLGDGSTCTWCQGPGLAAQRAAWQRGRGLQMCHVEPSTLL